MKNLTGDFGVTDLEIPCFLYKEIKVTDIKSIVKPEYLLYNISQWLTVHRTIYRRGAWRCQK